LVLADFRRRSFPKPTPVNVKNLTRSPQLVEDGQCST
jgi:hypothetical protein